MSSEPSGSTRDEPTQAAAHAPVVLTRPAPGSVQTIQLTSKRWKGLMLVALGLIVLGAAIGGWLLFRDPRLLTRPTWLMLGAVGTFIAGIIVLIVARLGAWWDHG